MFYTPIYGGMIILTPIYGGINFKLERYSSQNGGVPNGLPNIGQSHLGQC
jgi:hypothetical protein